ncbi:hematopoietic SH2 domain-containing protein homolog isoform X2 [Pungitius pungitius]|uniref:hematopoietic SH2 domain-containing protein homolog isoform X2 n=1 Tax=Pungitius pungitius TaxID=134920 RepID=UPI002E132C5E
MEKMRAEDGGQRELVQRWFTETQAPLVLHHGTFPDWFKGFAARRETEDLLSDKAPGCFLIRLSDRAIGYVLSYKGLDRCRHFVITQNPEGQFVIAGDCQPHGSLGELIQHYRLTPIQPYGEHLTSSWSQVSAGDTDELYDVVNYSAKGAPGLSVRALRTLWDNKHDPHGNHGAVQQSDAPAVDPPALPSKLNSRKLTGTMSLSQGVPSVPKRGLLSAFSLRGPLPDTTPQTQTDPGGSEGVRGNTSPTAKDSFFPLYPEIRSTSLLALGHGSVEEEEEEEEEEELPPPAPTSPSPAPPETTPCLTYSLHQPDLHVVRSNPLYQASSSPAQPQGVTYAEIPRKPALAAPPENTYESPEDVKTKKSQTSWGRNVSGDNQSEMSVSLEAQSAESNMAPLLSVGSTGN